MTFEKESERFGCPMCGRTHHGADKGHCPYAVLETPGIHRELKKVPDGTVLVREGEPLPGIFCLLQGTLLLLKRDQEGIERRICNLEPGDLLGIRDIFSPNGCSVRTAKAVGEVWVCFIPCEDVRQIAGIEPMARIHLMEVLCHQLSRLEPKLIGDNEAESGDIMII